MTYNRRILISLLWFALCCANFCVVPALAQREWARVTSDYFSSTFIQFPTVDTGYAVSGGIGRTTDGGQTWNRVSLPYDNPRTYGSSITFFGCFGWLVIEQDTIGQPARLLHTTDYGFSWKALPYDSTWRLENMNATIYFKSPSLGYLWWDSLFYISTDSGKSWQHRTVPPSQGEGSRIVAVGSPNVVVGQDNWGTRYHSIDTGATWQKYDGPDMTYIGASTWITPNARSTDNGQTWDIVQSTAEDPIRGMITDTLGRGMFQNRSGLLYYTRNYGLSWDSGAVPFRGIIDGTIIGDRWYALESAVAQNEDTTYPPGHGPILFRSTASSGVASNPESTTFRILSNPVAQFLRISFEDTPEKIRIVDFQGRTVARYYTQGGEYSIDVSSIPDGLYWVVTNSGMLPFIHLGQ